MAEINTQTIINAVTQTLRAAYPEAIILDDEATQGIAPGSFIVMLVNANQQQLTGSRYRRSTMFDAIYFSDNSTEECVEVADNLSMVLEKVITPGGDLLHGIGINWRVDDGVLHFMVGYNHHLLRPVERNEMETLKLYEGDLYG